MWRAHDDKSADWRRALGLAICLALAGCGSGTPAAPPLAAKAPAQVPAAPRNPAPETSAARPPVTRSDEPRASSTGDEAPAFVPAPPLNTSLADLAEQARQREFDPPVIDEERVAAAGIRKQPGKHLTIYTDLPEAEAGDLPALFDAAIPLWCAYFGADQAKLADWKIVGHVMRDKARFVQAGLYSDALPPFPNGYSQGSQFWIYDQPSEYYRRHLVLHEGTHCFMNRWLGGAGPPWYMEGIAELLGTHRLDGDKLALAVMPATSDEVPYWGRIKIIRDEQAAGRGMSLVEILRYDNHAHLRNEPYGWCWGTAAFLDGHPATREAFRGLKTKVKDRTIDFSLNFLRQLEPVWPQVKEDWQLFVLNADYGYDLARAAVVHLPVIKPLPAEGATATLAADRGWQSTGYILEAGRTYALEATGRYDVASGPPAWPCEAGGITLRYERGLPLGMLLAAVRPEVQSGPVTPLASPKPIGLGGRLTPTETGVLYLSINERAAGLADNRGCLMVTVRGE
jgi:hypothetical protein